MLEIKEIIDKKTWEEFLNKNFTTYFPFFQTWNWGEVQKTLGNRVYNLGLYEDKKLECVIQIIEIKAKRGHYLYWRHGPAIANFSKQKLLFILDFLKTLAKEKKCTFIRISRFFKSENLTTELFKKNGFVLSPLQTIDASVCWTLDITKSADEILKNMRKSHRYLIKKAQTMEIEVIKSSKEKDLDLFLPLYKKLAVRQKFVAHKGLIEEFKIFTSDNQCLLFLAKYQNKIIAGAFIDFVGDIAIYRHGASDDLYRQIPASYLLQWEAIKEAKTRNKKMYNFWGIAPEGAKNHPWSGLTLFKTGFGGETEYFLPTMDLPISLKYWKTYGIDLISNLIR